MSSDWDARTSVCLAAPCCTLHRELVLAAQRGSTLGGTFPQGLFRGMTNLMILNLSTNGFRDGLQPLGSLPNLR